MISMFKRIVNHPLNEGARLQAVGRFIKWQVRSRINQQPIIIPFVNDAKIIVKRGFSDSTAQLYNGLAEFGEMGFLLHFLRKEDLFVDVGANIGSYTILAAKVAKSEVIAFEPIPDSFLMLRENTSLNNITDHVKIYNKGVSGSESTLRFSSSYGQQNHVIDAKSKLPMIEVPTNTLDFFLENKNPTCLKIDVEGFETEVINGAKEVLSNQHLKVVIIELMGLGKRYDFDEKLIHDYLKELGFTIYNYDPKSRALNVQSSYQSKNIYIRDIDFVKERIRTADSFSVFNQQI